MIRKLLIILLVLFASGSLYAQSGAIKGKVLDGATGEAIPFANVIVELNGNMMGGGVTDFDGNYTIKPLAAGSYTIKASYVGYNSLQINDVIVNNDKIRFLDLSMNISTQAIEQIDVVAYTVPLIDKDNTQTGGTVTSEQISKMAGRSAESVAATVGGVYQEDGEVKSVRGSREDATVYYIDGVKVRGASNLPKSSIAEVSVITGGTPARYGDVTGGVINIVTKGASRTFFGGVGMNTSKFLDAYNSNIFEANLSGPILSRKIVNPDNPEDIRKEPLIGFFIAGEYQFTQDPNPSATGFWKINDEMLDSITRTPLVRVGGATKGRPTAEYLEAKDFENVKARENVAYQQAMFNGKIDFQPMKNLLVTLSGKYQSENGNYLPGNGRGGLSGSEAGGMLNYKNNTNSTGTNYVVSGKVTHNLSNENQDDKDNSSIIKNAYYSVMANYSKNLGSTQDERHKDNLFAYGYVGKFNTYQTPTYVYGYDTTIQKYGYLMNAFKDTLVTFESSDLNPDLARYTELYYDFFGNPLNKTQIDEGGGLLNSYSPGAIHGMVTAPGIPSGGYSKFDFEQFGISAQGAADLNNHEISVGFEFEKRTDRYFSAAPRGLWELARKNMNNHISDLNLADPIAGTIEGTNIYNDTINYNRAWNGAAQSLFDMKFRESQGITDSLQWVDVDSYDPSALSLEYFSADELFNNANSLVGYSGFDSYGNKLSGTSTFDDFFTKTYTYNGKEFFSREIAPFEPIYWAGYIQDKFAFNDLVFNVGVRIDGYDANQKVQTDPYLVYTAFKVKDEHGLIANTDVPDNINPEATVYVDNSGDPKKIVGYRYESQWYDANGSEVYDFRTLYPSGQAEPYRTDPNDQIGDESFLNAFKDYDPDINVLPRISFSFPISDEALFFAHYDWLAKRPSSGTSRLNPVELLYINQLATNEFVNPNLKSEKTIDYEIGFQQKLNNKSSLKISAFYREQRDMVQLIYRTGAYPINMKTFGNIDFGTVKGYTFTYDLRRTNNISLTASYTLQFANATGSDPTTARSLIAAGQPNLRATLPTNFDQRHALSLLLDYRFSSGKDYTGPKWFGADIFANAGCNFTVNSGSGTPYTPRDVNTGATIGSINKSIMPWRTTISVKIDKSFTLNFGEGENSRETDLNVYLDVTNLLNAKNTMGVYSTTGNPDDDAFLSSSAGISSINNAYNPQSYIDYYNMLLANPAHYNLPRQIRLGVLFSF
jgi:outer membrane receptor protein involved in Fe transport